MIITTTYIKNIEGLKYRLFFAVTSFSKMKLIFTNAPGSHDGFIILIDISLVVNSDSYSKLFIN
jgi:hypothetical protein